MDYELAKKLKEAGFPQVWAYGKGELYYGEKISNGMYEGIYIPNLSELIEACVDKILIFSYEEKWYATKYSEIINSCKPFYEFQVECEKYEGSTPEEAVANLYLKLHEN